MVLHLIRRLPLPEVEAPRVVAVDDWAIRKGRSYGTIMVDLECRRVVDLPGSRTSAGNVSHDPACIIPEPLQGIPACLAGTIVQFQEKYRCPGLRECLVACETDATTTTDDDC